jgi:hypothetical protein
MSIKRIVFMCLLYIFLTGTGAAVANDELYQGFVNPPAEVGPDVYWWWNANALSESEVLRELDILKEAGIHGVLIFPLQAPMAYTKTDDKQLKWLSPEWAKMLKFTIEAAKQRGIFVDLLVGTGWPFGGPFVENGDGIKIIKLSKKELKGPDTFKGNIKYLMVLPADNYNFVFCLLSQPTHQVKGIYNDSEIFFLSEVRDNFIAGGACLKIDYVPIFDKFGCESADNLFSIEPASLAVSHRSSNLRCRQDSSAVSFL